MRKEEVQTEDQEYKEQEEKQEKEIIMPIKRRKTKVKLTKSQKIQLDVFRRERLRLNREIRKSKIELKKARKRRGLHRKKKRS